MRDERRNNMRYNKRPLYDIEEILDNVTGKEVASKYFGLDIVHRGAYDFIHCPDILNVLERKIQEPTTVF